MKYYNITREIHPNMMVYKNKEEKRPVITHTKESSYESSILLPLHTGTHMDFPLHILENGKNSNSLNLDTLLTNIKVFDLSHLIKSIDEEVLKTLDIQENDFILFKTKNSFDREFCFDFVYLEEKASKYLVQKKIKGVGIDGLGIEHSQQGHPTHRNLFHNNITIIEGLNLSEVPTGHYYMIALPIFIKEVEALPLSIILIEKDSFVLT